MADVPFLMELREDSWREAYQGMIPHKALARMIEGRPEKWWRSCVQHSSLRVITMDEELAGYAAIGRNRHISLPYPGEIIELYLDPVFQGMGFGTRLFRDAGMELITRGFEPFIVWVLEDNERAAGFYRRMGGQPVGEAFENFGTRSMRKIAYGF